MLRANGIAPSSTVQKRPAEAQPEADVKEEVVDIEDDDDDEIRALEVSNYTYIYACLLH